MSWADIINGLYESFAGIFLFFSCLKLYKDKKVMGWSLSTQIFFTSWGYWNLFYYAHLNQWASWLGGILVVIFNTIWTSMAVYYTRKNSGKESILKRIRSRIINIFQDFYEFFNLKERG